MLYRPDRSVEAASAEITGTLPTSIAIRLGDIAHARSGDKGGGANIGVLAFNEEGFEFLLSTLSADRVATYFEPMQPGEVRRYELPNLLALNFVLPTVLAGGGSRSLHIDAQGKCLGQILLEMPLEIDPQRFARCARR